MHTPIKLRGGPFDGDFHAASPLELADVFELGRFEITDGLPRIVRHRYRVESVARLENGNGSEPVLFAQYHGATLGEPLVAE